MLEDHAGGLLASPAGGPVWASAGPRLGASGFRLTHQELAHLIGATRESVSVALGELAREDAVRTERGAIAIRTDRLRASLPEGSGGTDC